MSNGIGRQLGGMAANVACAAAALGNPWPIAAELIAPLGNDPDGVWVEGELTAKGVATERLNRDGGVTCQCLILVEPGGERAIVSESSRLDYALVGKRLSEPTPPGAVHVDGFHAAGVGEHFAAARRAGWHTSVDLDELPPQHLTADGLRVLFAGVDVAFVNRRCAVTAFGTAADYGTCIGRVGRG